MLEKIILQRKIEAISYEEYLRQVVELAEAILHPENSGDYPSEIKDSPARRALFDYFGKNIVLAVDLDSKILESIKPGWKENHQKKQNIKRAIYNVLISNNYSEDDAVEKTEQVFDIVQRQEEYDV